MKHLHTIFFLSALAVNVNAQQPFPIGATWHYTAPTWPEISYSKITSEKDTIILGRTCKKLTNLIGDEGRTDSDFPTRFVYQEGQEVYAYLPSLEKFGLLYDFSKTEGESWIVETDFYDFEVRVNAVNLIQINDSLRRVQYVDDNGAGHFRGTIIEGIGHTQYLFPMPGLADPAFGPLRCYEDSVLGFFQYEDSIQGTIPCDTTWNDLIVEEEMLPTGAEWHYETYSDFWAGTHYVTTILYFGYRVSGDTIIDDQVWKKVNRFDQFGESDSYMLLYEENKQIFQYYPQIQASGLLYDFNLNVGESYEGVMGYYGGDTLYTATVYVDSVKTILINQTERKVQYLSIDDDWFFYGKTIEGIGNRSNLLPRAGLDDSPASFLRCYRDSILGFFWSGSQYLSWEGQENDTIPCDTIWVDYGTPAEKDLYPIGAEWNYELLRTFGPYRYINFYTERITKDTIIHDKVCKIRRGFDSEGNAFEGMDIIYEEDGKVYRYFSVPDYFGLIYDFKLRAGESYRGTIGDGYYSNGVYVWDTLETAMISIDSISTMLINQEDRLVQYVTPDPNWDFGIPMIIEGIGGLYGSFFPQSALADGLGGGVTDLRCYSDSVLGHFQNISYPCDTIWEELIDNIEKDIEPVIRLYPNPTRDHLTLNIDGGNEHFSSIRIIDIKGSVMKKIEPLSPQRTTILDIGSFASGIYILEVELLSGERIRKKILKK